MFLYLKIKLGENLKIIPKIIDLKNISVYLCRKMFK